MRIFDPHGPNCDVARITLQQRFGHAYSSSTSVLPLEYRAKCLGCGETWPLTEKEAQEWNSTDRKELVKVSLQVTEPDSIEIS